MSYTHFRTFPLSIFLGASLLLVTKPVWAQTARTAYGKALLARIMQMRRINDTAMLTPDQRNRKKILDERLIKSAAQKPDGVSYERWKSAIWQ